MQKNNIKKRTEDTYSQIFKVARTVNDVTKIQQLKSVKNKKEFFIPSSLSLIYDVPVLRGKHCFSA